MVVSCHLDIPGPLPVGVGLAQQEVGAELDLAGQAPGTKEVPMTHGGRANLQSSSVSDNHFRETRETEGMPDRKEKGENPGLPVAGSSAQLYLVHLALLDTLEFR